MPRVPEFNRQTVSAQVLPNARLSEQTANVAGAFQGVANAARGLGEVFAREAQEERDRADNAAVIEAETALDAYENTALFDPQNGAFAKNGKNAFDLPGQVLPGYDSEVQRIKDSLGSDRAKLAFTQRATRRRGGINQQLNRYEGQQREVYYDQQDAAGIKSSQGVAANYYTDTKRIGEELAKQDLIIDARGVRKGLSPEQTAEEKRAARSGTQTDVVSRYLARGEYEKGRTYFESVRDQIGADEATRLEAAFTAESQRQENERKASNALLQQELSIQMADIRASAAAGIPVTQIPPRNVLEQAYGPVRGEQYYKQLQGAQQLSLEVQRLNSLSNGELQKLSQQYQPTQQQGAAEQTQLSNTLDQQISRVIAARREDPASYLQATSQSVAKAAQSLADNEAGSGQAYFNAVESEKARLGIRSTAIFPKGAVVGSDEYQQVALLATAKYRQLPPESAAFAVNALKSNDPAVVAKGAQLLDAVENIAPSAYTGVPEPLRARAAMIAGMINAGTNVERAVQTADDIQKLDQNVITNRNRAYGQYLKTNPGALKGFIDESFDPSVFYSQPQATQVLESEFNRQSQVYFRQTGDIDLSRKLAWTDLQRVYGVSEVNGKRQVVAFPLERFTVTRETFKKELTELLAGNPQADGSTVDEVTVVADNDTLRKVTDGLSGTRVRPSYRLVTKTGDLARYASDGPGHKKGMPIRYFVPSDEDILGKIEEENKRREEQGELTRNAAKKEREARELKARIIQAK
jgi:hypothetical protein